MPFSFDPNGNTYGSVHGIISNMLTVQPPWRNWLARSAVNRKVGGSSPPGGVLYFCNILCISKMSGAWRIPWQSPIQVLTRLKGHRANMTQAGELDCLFPVIYIQLKL